MPVDLTTPRILLAPNAFKGTLSAAEVASHLARGIRQVLPSAEIVTVPVADGGDGTVAAVCAAGFTRVPVTVTGPTGEAVGSAYARRADDAVVEFALASGLALLPGGRTAPLSATSYGTGELIAAALDAGCRQVVVGIGGSACTDGGAGLLVALGARVLTCDGAPVARGGAALASARVLDVSGLHPQLASAALTVAGDVDNPLTGPDGAAAVYGPQKGASPRQITDLDAALSHWADLVAREVGADLRDAPGSGAAGGVGFALHAVLGAAVEPGAGLIGSLTGLESLVATVDLVVTGEGRLDGQTLHGKAPAAVASLAHAARTRVVAVAGSIDLTPSQLCEAGFAAAYPLTDLAPLHRCLTSPGPVLEAVRRPPRDRPPRPRVSVTAHVAPLLDLPGLHVSLSCITVDLGNGVVRPCGLAGLGRRTRPHWWIQTVVASRQPTESRPHRLDRSSPGSAGSRRLADASTRRRRRQPGRGTSPGSAIGVLLGWTGRPFDKIGHRRARICFADRCRM